MAKAGGIPPEAKQKAGEEAIELARKALELHTQLHGTESIDVAADMSSLADVLGIGNVDDDEIPRLYEQAIVIFSRLQGSSSPNVAIGKMKLGNAYKNKATTANAANDLNRCMANLELALTQYREAARIFSIINHVDNTNAALHNIAEVEKNIRKIEIVRAAATTTTAGATRG